MISEKPTCVIVTSFSRSLRFLSVRPTVCLSSDPNSKKCPDKPQLMQTFTGAAEVTGVSVYGSNG